jgi:NADH:ubiquinone oxidoreductase subunit 5 (subunit L)/multisubunit Na+/H+ antiporter MnhA subunit
MEGPTPVSALIHAATMVTAGVFVVLRCSPIIETSQVTLLLISTVGALTAFFAGTVGLFQNDIKRVIAYSTCSQLGYMFFACGVSGYSAALFHLFNHGFFKALLFLGAGSVIHAISDEQDMRKMGALLCRMPVTYIIILIGSLSLIGFPFTSGFYSKELILGVSFNNIYITGGFVVLIGILTASITTFYSLRLIIYVFFNRVNYTSPIFLVSSESNSFIFPVLLVLSFITIFVGFFLKDLFVGAGSDLLSVSIFQFGCTAVLEAEFLP